MLCITDHLIRRDAPWLTPAERHTKGVLQEHHGEYVREITSETLRARQRYDLLVIPGLELTYNDRDPASAAHAVAVGLHEFVPVDDGIDAAVDMASTLGAAIIAAHPSSTSAHASLHA